MANSKEQVCAEKLRSLLRIGAASMRFKDVFDVYYLLCCEGVDAGALNSAMHVLVYDATDMREGGPFDVRARLSRVFNDRRFRRNLGNARNNWLGASVEKVIAGILRYFGWGGNVGDRPVSLCRRDKGTRSCSRERQCRDRQATLSHCRPAQPCRSVAPSPPPPRAPAPRPPSFALQ